MISTEYCHHFKGQTPHPKWNLWSRTDSAGTALGRNECLDSAGARGGRRSLPRLTALLFAFFPLHLAFFSTPSLLLHHFRPCLSLEGDTATRSAWSSRCRPLEEWVECLGEARARSRGSTTAGFGRDPRRPSVIPPCPSPAASHGPARRYGVTPCQAGGAG